MHLEVEHYPMTSSATRKWVCLGEGEQAALNYVLNDAILHIQRVAEYRHQLLRLRRGIAHVHWFRIGHAMFEIAILKNFPPIITDIGWVT
jgi:hypothetical protein